MVTDEDIERTGYTRAELIDDAIMSLFISDNPSVRHFAGTILHLLNEFPWQHFPDNDWIEFLDDC